MIVAPKQARIRWFPMIVSAFCVAVAARLAMDEPRYVLLVVALVALGVAPAWLSRRRSRRLLVRGDVEEVLGAWEPFIDNLKYPETMAPLIRATAYAAYGWQEYARRALDRAVRGPAWDAAVEQRLFVETILDAYEGERDEALKKSAALVLLPLPPADLFTRRRITRLRHGVAALARAFAHTSDERDARTLLAAAEASPLVHWAMRYAAAIVAIDHGHPERVGSLLKDAPNWPKQSAFRGYHDEIVTQAGA